VTRTARNYPFVQVDAFTERALEGNPCAVVFEADDLADAAMLAVAREMNLSETAFVRRPRDGDAAARYFTPAEEIPLAGHPTIATIHALAESGRLRLSGERTPVVLELRDGPIQVEVLADGGRVREVVMTQRRPQFLSTYAPEEVLPAFGLQPADALPGAPIQTVSTGTPQLMVPLRDHAALCRAALDVRRYAALRSRADFFSPHLYCLGGATSRGRTFARHFGVPPDVMEDPFTGSATGGMACHLWRYGLIDEPRFVAEQGHWMGRPGRATVEVVGPPGAIESVRVGGGAVTVMAGTLSI
jgi:trans-2,3-dihydro-3-hydroxyanthranilate isomerase